MRFMMLPGGALIGEARVPGDKSISHRAVMLGALAHGTTRVNGFLEGEDALATLAAFRSMGVHIDGPASGRVTIHGVGLHGLKAPGEPLDLGNAGTGMRLLCGLLVGQTFDTELTGDASLRSRPMGRVIDPLTRMGASIQPAEGGRPPLAIRGGQRLRGIHYDLPMASAQVKSCVLLAGMYSEGSTSVTEPAPTRDHTERMLRGFGYQVLSENGVVSLQGGGVLEACDIDVPADISSAAFFLVAASIAPESDVLLTHVGVNPTRIGVINILQLMGADITLHNQREVGGEPVADIRVRYAPLRGIEIPIDQVPLAIDEFPALFIAAACAEGRTVLRGAEELRVKESDRIAAMAEGLNTLGVCNEVLEDGIIIEGGAMGGGAIRTYHDHRIAMAFAVAALRAASEVTVLDCDHVATSFPGFDTLARSLGLQISIGAD
jgi:3-phosphoshikimate 1-carboxyvinyltransferase